MKTRRAEHSPRLHQASVHLRVAGVAWCWASARQGRWRQSRKGVPECLHLCDIRWCFEAKIFTPGGEMRIVVGIMPQQRSPFGQHISDFSTEAPEMLRSTVTASTSRLIMI